MILFRNKSVFMCIFTISCPKKTNYICIVEISIDPFVYSKKREISNHPKNGPDDCRHIRNSSPFFFTGLSQLMANTVNNNIWLCIHMIHISYPQFYLVINFIWRRKTMAIPHFTARTVIRTFIKKQQQTVITRLTVTQTKNSINTSLQFYRYSNPPNGTNGRCVA